MSSLTSTESSTEDVTTEPPPEPYNLNADPNNRWPLVYPVFRLETLERCCEKGMVPCSAFSSDVKAVDMCVPMSSSGEGCDAIECETVASLGLIRRTSLNGFQEGAFCYLLATCCYLILLCVQGTFYRIQIHRRRRS